MIQIPDINKKIFQFNRGNQLGNLWSTWNIDLQSNPGAIRVGSKMKLNVSTATEGDLGFPVAFQYFDSMMWALCGTRVFKNTSSDLITAFTTDTSTGYVTTYDKNYADMLVFNGALVATADTKIWSKASNGSGSGSWTERGSTSLTTGTSHKMAYFKRHNRLYILDNKVDIKSVDTSWTVASSGDYFIDLGDDTGRAVTMAATDNSLFIGTLRPTNTVDDAISKGSVLEWDGISSSISNRYEIDAQGVLAMTVLNGVLHIMDTNGVLSRFTGAGFQEVGRLPVDKEMLSKAISTFNERFIHPNGMISTKDGTIEVLVNNLIEDNTGSIKENFPSGIWEWSNDHGFVHKHPITYQPMATTTITDNGQNRVVKVGALANANILSTSASGRSTKICGLQYYTDASSTTFGIFIEAPIPTDNATTTEGQKYGYFVTQWAISSQVTSIWQKAYIKYKQLLNSTDKIILKYRTREIDPIYIDITWVNTTQFSSTTDLTNYVGYEVEIIQGTGSGKCAHIESITGNNPWKANLDETFTGVTTGTGKARLQKWKKLSSANYSDLEEVTQFLIAKTDMRIQLKCCMDWKNNNELFELVCVDKTHKPL